MSDDDSDKDILAGDSDNENVQPDVPPEELTEKQKKALEKLKKKWRIFLDFLLRHISIVTFKYNTFEREEYPDFVEAMAKAESLRSKLKERPKKLKKGEDETIRCFRQMKITTEMLTEHRHYTEAHRIQKFMNLAGRMRGLGMIARSFMVTLRKGKVRNLDKIKYYFDYWRGFTIRTFDYTDLRVKGTDHNNRINKYQTWPCVIRTSLWLAQKFLKRASDAIEMPLMTEDPRGMQQHMSAAEFVVANRIEALLTKKVQQEAKSFVLGWNPLGKTGSDDTKMELPDVDIDPDFLKPIQDNSMMCELPEEIPKEKKKKKKKKKKGFGSYSSYSSGKKKKKKK